jgi:HindIII restriction endonuclease
MIRNEFIKLIFEVSKKPNAFDIIEKELANVSKQELSEFIIECGILPEMFQHDSSEEKLWAKYSDIVLAKCLTHLGINSTVLRTRGNSADIYGKDPTYTIVGDAKTFRLSRTAKNQKDFKVKALDDWRREDTYAVLVSPLLQYPTNKSQIYSQAIERNVTLISYTHLKLLLDSPTTRNLEDLWNIGKRLQTGLTKEQYEHSRQYWQEVDKTVCRVVEVNEETIHTYKQLEIENTRIFGQEGIEYWNSVIENYKNLSKEDAVKKLIKAEKIEEKIRTIQKAISRNTRPYNE